MISTFLKRYNPLNTTLLFGLLFFAAGCGQEEKPVEAVAAAATEEAAAQATAVVGEKRPAPEFFFIPQELVNKRVWLCEDGISDIFHLRHDCPILIRCRGKGSFRNVKLPRAIETHGRYNCQECSKELDAVFDEDAVRQLGG